MLECIPGTPERFAKGKCAEAVALMHDLIEAPRFVEFLALPAYDRVLTLQAAQRLRSGKLKSSPGCLLPTEFVSSW